MKPLSKFITGLLAGAAVGGVIALLYAPQSGKETREQIKRKFKDLEDQLDSLKGKKGEEAQLTKEELAAKIAALQREIDLLSKEL
ncbi:MAG: YtxH domain-containing protein [Salinivirgaceae bacterium]